MTSQFKHTADNLYRHSVYVPLRDCYAVTLSSLYKDEDKDYWGNYAATLKEAVALRDRLEKENAA